MFASFTVRYDYSVFLPGDRPVALQGDPFNAGHTTRWFAQRYSINAIQIETSSVFRKHGSQLHGEKLASHMAEFFAHYYK